jgi:protein dpy-30
MLRHVGGVPKIAATGSVSISQQAETYHTVDRAIMSAAGTPQPPSQAPTPAPGDRRPTTTEDEAAALAAEMQYYDDMAQGLYAEGAALHPSARVPVQALPPRHYLDATVVPLLLLGLEAVAQDRPKDPVEYLAAFLLSNNPQRDETLPMPPGHQLLRGLVPRRSAGGATGATPAPTSAAPTPTPI